MFVTKARYELEIYNLEMNISELSKRYWEMQLAHAMLLGHLGLHEVEIPPSKVLRSKGGPEQG